LKTSGEDRLHQLNAADLESDLRICARALTPPIKRSSFMDASKA